MAVSREARSMPRSGAPTGKWSSVPPHVGDESEPADMTSSGARILIRRPGVPEVELVLERLEFVIGRQVNEVDLALDDDMVSRRHARITMDSRGYFRLEDLGSRNGIQYAGRIVRRLNLVDGDVFSIGKAEFVFHASMSRFKKADGTPARQDSVFDEIPVPKPEKSVIADAGSGGPEGTKKG
jgi:pSer/pThr/pTyr-binding forkhead associated (FHA) protein